MAKEQIGLAAVLALSQWNKGVSTYLGDLGKMEKQTGGVAGRLGKTLATIGAVGAAGAAAGLAALGAGLVASTNTAISFQSAFAGVIKTTEGLADETGQLTEAGKELRAEFVNLSKEAPLAFEELAAIGELGGQLGIGKDALIDFTETIAALGVSTNLSTEEAATSLARMSNIFAVSQEEMGNNIERLGSTIVALGNNFATTEREIVAFGERIAGAGAIAGLTQDQVLAIGTAMSSVGVEAEAGGTAVQKVLLAMNNAVNGATTGFVDNTAAIDKNVEALSKAQSRLVTLEAQTGLTGDEILAMREDFIASGGAAEDFGRLLGDKNRAALFEAASNVQDLTGQLQLLREENGKPIDAGQISQFAAVAGLSADEFKKAWEQDAAGAFQLFVEGLGAQGDNAANVLDELGLADQRLIRAFLSLSGAGDLLSRTLEVGSTAWSENTALANEAAQRYATTESQIQLFKNTMRALGDEIGTRLLPFVNKLIGAGIALVEQFSGPLVAALDNQLIPAFENMIAFVDGLAQAFQTGGLSAVGEILGQQIMDAWTNNIQPALQVWGEQFWDWLNQTALPAASTQLATLTAFVATFLADQFSTTIQPALQTWADQFFEWVALAYSQIPNQLNTLTTGIATFLSTAGPVLSEAMAEWIPAFWAWVQEATNQVGTVLAALLVAMVAWASSGEAQTNLQEVGRAIADFTLAAIQTTIESGDQFPIILGKIALGLGAAVAAIAGTLVIIGANIVAGIIDGLLEAIGVDLEPAAATELITVWKGIEENVKTIVFTVGQNMIQGMIDGIASMGDTLKGEVERQAGQVIDFYSNLFGINSPSTVFFAFGQDTVQGLINGLASMAGNLASQASSLFGSLFGGGGEEAAAPTLDTSALAFDTGPLSGGLAGIQASLNAISQLLITIHTVDLVNLGVAFVTMATGAVAQLTLVLTTTTQENMLLIQMSTVTLPQLLTQSNTTTAGMVTGLTQVISVTIQENTLISQMISLVAQLQATAKKMADSMVDAWERIAEATEEAIEAVELLAKAYSKLAAAAREAQSAAQGVANAAAAQGLGFSGGVGFAGGVGFQSGTLGWTVPAGFPNDTFRVGLTSGEEVLVAPRSTSIEEIVAARFGPMGGGGTINAPVINIGPVTITNGMDMRAFEAGAQRAVAKGLSR